MARRFASLSVAAACAGLFACSVMPTEGVGIGGSRVTEDRTHATAGGDPMNTAAASASAAGCATNDGSSPDALRADVEFLASKELAGRSPGTAGDAAARTFIEERFKCLGLAPGADDGGYQQPFTNRGGEATANVVSILPGTDPSIGSEIVVVGAHHDHFGMNGGKGLRLGANDNGSGVAGVLAAARLLTSAKKAKGGFRRTIAFVTWGSEETLTEAPFVEGSDFFIRHPPAKIPIARVVHNVNLDMVGTYDEGGSSLLAQGTTSGSPGRAILQSLLPNFAGLDVELGKKGEVGDSDFDPFCRKGIPYVGFFTDDPSCYHKDCDTADRLDYTHMSQIVQLVAELSSGLANSPDDIATQSRKAGCTLDEGDDDDDDDDDG